MTGLLSCVIATPAMASSLVPGPGDPGYDAALAEKARRFGRQLHAIHTLPTGFGMDAKITDPENVALVEAFIASDADDFEAFAKKHPYEIVEDYGDYLHAAIFGGFQIAGDAFRYATLRDEGAPRDEVDRARLVFVNNLETLDRLVRITGEPGVVARGIRRITPQSGAPAVPGTHPEPVPFFDDDGAVLPRHKQPTWRADRSGSLPFLVWIDDTSRDTFVGYVYALGVSYDVGADDPTIPAATIARLRENARAIGVRLLDKVDVGASRKIDLVLRDWDDRPTTYHALSAEEVLEGFVDDEGGNGFNAVMGLGILRTLYHVSGEPELYARYRELVGRRDYLGVIERTLTDTIYFDEITNYSVVNMAYLALYGLLRYEHDPALAARYRDILERHAYDADVDRDARGLSMAFFDFVFAGFAETGTVGVGAAAVVDGNACLVGHADSPYWDRSTVNCDEDEVAARDCTLLDGSRVRLASRRGYGGERVVAVEPVPVAVRPPTDFAWRSDPHAVNGGGKARLHFGGDLYGAYWLGRYLRASSSGYDNISPLARDAPDEVTAEGCSCAAGERLEGLEGIPLFALLVLLARRRSRAS